MPKGEGQKGKRRGRYAPRAATKGQVEATTRSSPYQAWWSSEDREHYDGLVSTSPLASAAAKANAARRATELSRQLRELDQRPRTVDEEKAMVSASSQYRKWLEVLRVTDKVRDDDEGEL